MPEHQRLASYSLEINTGGWECRRNKITFFNSDLFHAFIFHLDDKDSLCELHIKQGCYELAAFLAAI